MGLRGPGARPAAVAKPASSKRKRVEALRHPRRDRPEPTAICRRRVRPHDAAEVPVAVERDVTIVRPLAARAVFGGAFEGWH